MFLTDEEIVELTRRRQRKAQAMQLRFLGIEHRTRADGSLVILRAHVEEVLGKMQAKRSATPTEPNFADLNENSRPRKGKGK